LCSIYPKSIQLQLQLTAEQLLEDFTRVLTANDPNVPNNITKYNYKEKAYKQDPEGPMDHLIFHFQLDGCSLHKESEDVVLQQEFEDNKKMEIDRLRKEAALEAFEVIAMFRTTILLYVNSLTHECDE
jgi:dynein intermediate chain 1, axonemal